MSIEPAPTRISGPERDFARSSWLMFGAALILVSGSHLAIARVLANQSEAETLALTSAAEAAAAHAVVAELQILPLLTDEPRAMAGLRLGWALDQLATMEERRLAASTLAATATSGPSGVLAAVDSARPLTGTADAAEIRRIRDAFEASLLPQLDVLALRHKVASERAAALGRRTLWTSAVALFGLGGLAFAGIACPTRRRIRAWAAASQEAERENSFRLLHDPVSGLANATYLDAFLERLAAGADRSERQLALLRLDLGRYKAAKETLGRRTAEDIIRIAGRRLGKTLRAGDFAAHLGEDDFAVVTEIDAASSAATVAGRLQAVMAQPFSVRGGPRKLGCRIGVTVLGDAGATVSPQLLANAEIALAAARDAPGPVHYFRPGLRQEAEQREALLHELLEGLDMGEIVPFFQPQIMAAGSAFTGFEALVRWRHPTRGLLLPASFLDFAEQADLVERVGDAVMTQTLAAMRDWTLAGLSVPRVGVNFSLCQLRDPRLVEKIKWEAERLDIDPARIAIEVLETVPIRGENDLVLRNLRGLASAGFPIELDDFGTGHASISNLRRFSVDRMKIDRSFILGIELSAEQRSLTASMIAMAHALGIAVVAEGVESAEAAAVLRGLGCDFLQGYAIGVPLSVTETEAWLQALYRDNASASRAADPSAADPNMP